MSVATKPNGIHPSAIVSPQARIGTGCFIGPFSIVGDQVELKDGVRLESHVVIDGRTVIGRGTAGGGMLTQIGDDCLLMAQAHVAHDCRLGNGVIMANAATLAGHVIIEDNANVGAYSGVHQFCRVCREAYIGGYSVVVKDALPFALTVGNHARCYGLNTTGMKRRGYPAVVIGSLHRAFRLLLSTRLNTSQALEAIKEELQGSAEVSS